MVSNRIRKAGGGFCRQTVRTIYLGAGVDNAAFSVSKHGVVTAIFLAEMSLLVLSFDDIVYLHTIVAFRRKEKAPEIIKADGQNGILKRRSLAGRWLATKELLGQYQLSAPLKFRRGDCTFVGLYKGIISVSLAVARGVLTIPLGFWLSPSPLDPMGESTAIGVNDMVTDHSVAFKIRRV